MTLGPDGRAAETALDLTQPCPGLTEAQVDQFVTATCGRRDAHGEHVYADESEWAEDAVTTVPSAGDLPVGSVVATDTRALIKSDEDDYFMWRDGGYGYSDQQVDELLMSHGATVLRVGTGGA